MDETKHTKRAACGGGVAGREALRLAAQCDGFDPSATSLQCSALGLPKFLAIIAEEDRKSDLEAQLASALDNDAARRAAAEKDHVSTLKTAFSATDEVLKRLRGSIHDKQAQTADLAAELSRLSLGGDV